METIRNTNFNIFNPPRRAKNTEQKYQSLRTQHSQRKAVKGNGKMVRKKTVVLW
jgi:hypothetical protein